MVHVDGSGTTANTTGPDKGFERTVALVRARFIPFVLPAGPPEQPLGAVPRRLKHGGPKRLLWKVRLEFAPLKFQMSSVGVAERARPKFWPKGPEFGNGGRTHYSRALPAHSECKVVRLKELVGGESKVGNCPGHSIGCD